MRRAIQAIGNQSIGVGIALVADLGIEEAAEQRDQVAGVGVREQQLLRRHRAAGIHRQCMACVMPLAQRGHHVVVEWCGEVALAIAGFPDQALQGLEGGVLAVLVDPALQCLDDHLVLAQAAAFHGDDVQPVAHLRIMAMFADEIGQGGACVREQHVADEGDRTGRAFDVGEDRGFLHLLVIPANAGSAPSRRRPNIQHLEGKYRVRRSKSLDPRLRGDDSDQIACPTS